MLEQVASFLNSHVNGCEASVSEREVGDSSIYIDPSHIKAVCEALKVSSEYDMTTLQVVTGCDYDDRIEVSYILASFRKNTEVIIKVKLSKKSADEVPELESLCGIWKSANFLERECYDMVGVKFLNHPDLRRILCPDDWTGYPLRKDYCVQEKYNGMVVDPEEKVNRDDHHFHKKLQDEMGDPKKVIFSWKGD